MKTVGRNGGPMMTRLLEHAMAILRGQSQERLGSKVSGPTRPAPAPPADAVKSYEATIAGLVAAGDAHAARTVAVKYPHLAAAYLRAANARPPAVAAPRPAAPAPPADGVKDYEATVAGLLAAGDAHPGRTVAVKYPHLAAAYLRAVNAP
jgi:hypothetical protein